jgi:hypothetical protein
MLDRLNTALDSLQLIEPKESFRTQGDASSNAPASFLRFPHNTTPAALVCAAGERRETKQLCALFVFGRPCAMRARLGIRSFRRVGQCFG